MPNFKKGDLVKYINYEVRNDWRGIVISHVITITSPNNGEHKYHVRVHWFKHNIPRKTLRFQEGIRFLKVINKKTNLTESKREEKQNEHSLNAKN